MKYSIIYLSLLSSLALTGCGAGDAPYDEVEKDSDMITSKSIDDLGETQYLYMRSFGDAPRYAAQLDTFGQGPQKIVTIHRTPAGIQFREVDPDTISGAHKSRYTNDVNNRPVMTIPGQYVNYQCAEDSNGHCSNREEEDRDPNTKWQDKKYFIPKFDSITFSEVTRSDIWGVNACAKETTAPHLITDGDWSGYEVDFAKGVINIELEHTYSATSACISSFYGNAQSMGELSFTTTEFISIVRLDKLASKNYKPIMYTQTDEDAFKFLSTHHETKDEIGNSGREGNSISYLNRWNPINAEGGKNTITYYLSNNFGSDENTHFLDATNEVVTIINKQNEWAKTGLPTVEVKLAGESHRFGDLRYSNITLFDEPLANNLLGYGPSAMNPLTGEIISSRVNQYGGNLINAGESRYERLRILYNTNKLDAEQINNLIKPQVKYITAAKTKERAKLKTTKSQVYMHDSDVFPTDSIANQGSGGEFRDSSSSLMDVEQSRTAIKDALERESKIMQFHASHNMYSQKAASAGDSLFLLPLGVKGYEIDWKIPAYWINDKVGTKLKKFRNLSDDVKLDLAKRLAVQSYAQTLIHELGHSFGLLHNFLGSVDKDNYWSTDDVSKYNKKLIAATGDKNLSLRSDTSSAMDYTLNSYISSYGRYDLAALRYAYAREVELKGAEVSGKVMHSGKYKSLKAEDDIRAKKMELGYLRDSSDFGSLYALSQQQKGIYVYKSCYGPDKFLSTTCNVFDRGANNDEIVSAYIDSYEDFYYQTNTRDGLESFGNSSMMNYVLTRLYTFNNIHSFIENTTSYPLDRYIYKVMKDDLNATNKAGKFFLKTAGMQDATVYIDVQVKDVKRVETQRTIMVPLSSLLDSYKTHISGSNGPTFGQALSVDFDFDEGISSISDNPDTLKELATLFTVTYYKGRGEEVVGFNGLTQSGKLLNGRKGPKTSSNHPYTSDLDILGNWPDKLLAVRNLVKHSSNKHSSTEGFKAFVDLQAVPLSSTTKESNSVGEIFEAMLCFMTQGPDVDNSCDSLAKNSVKAASIRTDVLKYMPDFQSNDYEKLAITPFGSFNIGLAYYFGFDLHDGTAKGNANLLKMMIRQVKLVSDDGDDRGHESADKWREFVNLHQDIDGTVAAQIDYAGKINQDASIVLGDYKTYVASEGNILAKLLIQRIKLNQQVLDEAVDPRKASYVAALVKAGMLATKDLRIAAFKVVFINFGLTQPSIDIYSKALEDRLQNSATPAGLTVPLDLGNTNIVVNGGMNILLPALPASFEKQISLALAQIFSTSATKADRLSKVKKMIGDFGLPAVFAVNFLDPVDKLTSVQLPVPMGKLQAGALAAKFAKFIIQGIDSLPKKGFSRLGMIVSQENKQKVKDLIARDKKVLKFLAENLNESTGQFE